MNLYSINTIKQELSFSPLIYRIKKADYSESLILNYTDTDNNVQQEILETSRSMLSNWMETLDYDTENKETLETTFDLLLSSVYLFGIHNIQKDNLETDIDNFIKKFKNSAFSDTASSVLDILKECFDPHPVLTYLYPHYYVLLHSLYLYAEKSCSYAEIKPQFTQKISALIQELLHLKSSYEQAREYIQSVLIEPYIDSASIASTASAALYHSYCKMLNKSEFYMEAFDFPVTKDYLKNVFSNGTTPSWSAYFESFSEKLSDVDTQDYSITSFAQFLHIGLSLMMSGETVIRKCKLCNGYFQTKHSSDQMYCSRIYKNTAATCSEVGVRKTYKEKLFQHPIHQEFTKSYNKLYGRIRRGKVPNDTPLMDQLKKLHDEYTEKYENTHKKDREAVWKEYIQKNKELLG